MRMLAGFMWLRIKNSWAYLVKREKRKEPYGVVKDRRFLNIFLD